jgi:hypothetical protein
MRGVHQGYGGLALSPEEIHFIEVVSVMTAST